MRTLKSVVTALALIAASGVYAAQVTVPQTQVINTGTCDDGKAVIMRAQTATVRPAEAQATPTVINVIFTTGPSSRSSSYPMWLANDISNLRNTGAARIGDGAEDPSILELPDLLYPGFIIESETIPLWRAIQNPTNPLLRNELGCILLVGVIVENSQVGFRLSDLRFTQESDDVWNGQLQNSLGVVHRFNDISYGPNCVGVVWNNGVPTLITSGSPDQVVNQLFFAGYGKNFRVDSQAALDNALLYIAQQPNGLTIKGRYDLLGQDGQPVATGVKQLSTVPYQAVRPSLVITPTGDSLRITVTADPLESYTVQMSSDLMGWWDYTTVYSPTGVSTFLVPADQVMGFFK